MKIDTGGCRESISEKQGWYKNVQALCIFMKWFFDLILQQGVDTARDGLSMNRWYIRCIEQ